MLKGNVQQNVAFHIHIYYFRSTGPIKSLLKIFKTGLSVQRTMSES